MWRREFTCSFQLRVFSGSGVRGHSGSCWQHPASVSSLQAFNSLKSEVIEEREAAAAIMTLSLQTHMNILAFVYINTHFQHSPPPHTNKTLVQQTTNQEPPCYISVTVCRGRSTATSVRQKIGLCGWRLMNTLGAIWGRRHCPLRLLKVPL